MSEVVHVHVLDEEGVIEEYRRKGYVLLERDKPSILAQPGFLKLVFVPADMAAPEDEETSTDSNAPVFAPHPANGRPAVY